MNNKIQVDNPTRFVSTPRIVPNQQYDRPLFIRKLIELGLSNGFTEQVFLMLDEQFSLTQLEDAVRHVLRQFRAKQAEYEPISKGVIALAKSNYESTLRAGAKSFRTVHLSEFPDRNQWHRRRPVRAVSR